MDTKNLNNALRSKFSIEKEIDQRMLASAKLLGISRNQLVRDAVNFYIKSEKFQKKLSDAMDSLKAQL